MVGRKEPRGGGRFADLRCSSGRQEPLAEHCQGLEDNLWQVVRMLDEQAALFRRLATREDPPSVGQPDLHARARHCEHQAERIRSLLREEPPSPE